MDLEQAIHKHGEWKVKFRTALGRHETFDAATIAKDNCCELGKWLYGEAKTRWSALPAYRSCVAKHAEFHTQAARVAQAINAKKYPEAEALLGPGSAYSSASQDVVVAIAQLKREAAL